MSNHRKRKLVRHDLQLKVVFISLFVASLVLLINFQLSLAALWSLSGKLMSSTDVTLAFEELRQSVISRFLVSVGMAIPLSAAIGILYSFKFSGPIYRFKKYFTDISSGGRWDERCSLRQGDDLQDVCDSINEAMDGIRDFMAENRSLFQELQVLHASGSLEADGDARASLNRLMNRVAVVNATFQERLSAWPPAKEDGQAQGPQSKGDTAAEKESATPQETKATGAAVPAGSEAAEREGGGGAREEERELETQV